MNESNLNLGEVSSLCGYKEPVFWDTIFMDMAFAIKQRSKDPSTNVGAILVNGLNQVISCGFNGPPRQLDDSLVPWNVRPDKYDFIIHAEENALLFGLGFHGSGPLIGSKMYCTHMSCPGCVLRMIRAGVSEYVYPKDSADYPLRKILDSPDKIIAAQTFPKIKIRMMEYHASTRN